MSPLPVSKTNPPKPPRRPLSGITRCVVIPLLLLTIGVRIGMWIEARHHASELSAPPQPARPPLQKTEAGPRGPDGTAAAVDPKCELSTTFENNLYPSLLLSFGAAYPEYQRCLRIAIRNALPGKACQLRIDSNLFLQSLEYSAPAAAAEFSLNPDLPWNYEALRRITQPQPESFVATLIVDGRVSDQETLTCIVHSVNDAVARLFNPTSGQWQDTSVCFAAYVNENHPWINGLLQEAQARSGIQAFTGYQSGDVMAQVQAVWDALAARGLRYVNLSTESAASPGVSTQYVRFLDQSVQDQGANCVDASVLLASIFRRIGLRPVLIFKPGHCFVAIYDAAEGGHLIALETTLLSSASAASAAAVGAQEFQATLPYLGTLQYSMVDIAQARLLGISPIGFEPAARP